MKSIFKVFVVFSLFTVSAALYGGTISIPPCGIVPSSSNEAINYQWQSDPQAFCFLNYAFGHAYIPLKLPQGVRIRKLVVYFSNPGADEEMYVSLGRVNLATGQVDTMATVICGSRQETRTAWYTTRISYGYVNNGTYAYFLGISFYDNYGYTLKFHGAKIIY